MELSSNLKVGWKTSVGAFTKIKADRGPLVIGKNVQISSGCRLGSGEAGLMIGDDCLIGPQVKIIGLNYAYDRLDLPIRLQAGKAKGIVIENDVWIGAGACVMDGSQVGRGVIVTPNSVVSGRVPAYVIVQGNPAKIIFKRR